MGAPSLKMVAAIIPVRRYTLATPGALVHVPGLHPLVLLASSSNSHSRTGMSQMGEGISHLSQLAVLRKLAGTSTPQLLQYAHLADFDWASILGFGPSAAVDMRWV